MNYSFATIRKQLTSNMAVMHVNLLNFELESHKVSMSF